VKAYLCFIVQGIFLYFYFSVFICSYILKGIYLCFISLFILCVNVFFEFYSYRIEEGIYLKCFISCCCPCPSKLYIVKGVQNPGHAELT
jgi:hypothetical protein